MCRCWETKLDKKDMKKPLKIGEIIFDVAFIVAIMTIVFLIAYSGAHFVSKNW